MRLARGVVDNRPRQRLPLEDGEFAVMACVDRELGYAGLKSYAWTGAGTPFVVLLFSLERGEARGGDRGRQARPAAHRRRLRCRGAVPGARRRREPRRDRLRLAGRVADRVHPGGGAVDRAGRRLLPRTRERLAEFCRANDCEPAETHREAADARHRRDRHDLEGPRAARRVAAGRARSSARSARTTRRGASSTTPCSSAPRSCAATPASSRRLESGDLIEPVERGVLDWLEVHELQEVVTGEVAGRASAGRRRRLQVERHRGVGPRGRRARRRARARARRRGRARRRS